MVCLLVLHCCFVFVVSCGVVALFWVFLILVCAAFLKEPHVSYLLPKHTYVKQLSAIKIYM